VFSFSLEFYFFELASVNMYPPDMNPSVNGIEIGLLEVFLINLKLKVKLCDLETL